MHLIWDFDGTLFDSYPKMIKALVKTTKNYGIEQSYEEIMDFVISKSIREYLNDLSYRTGLDIQVIRDDFSHEQAKDTGISPMIEGSKEVLERLHNKGIKHYIYTHKNDKTHDILRYYGLEAYFEEVVTSHYGFKLKPDGEGIEYLVRKYHLPKNFTFYIGDRLLDILAGKNAGVKTILFNNEDKTIDADYRISSLMDLDFIFKDSQI